MLWEETSNTLRTLLYLIQIVISNPNMTGKVHTSITLTFSGSANKSGSCQQTGSGKQSGSSNHRGQANNQGQATNHGQAKIKLRQKIRARQTIRVRQTIRNKQPSRSSVFIRARHYNQGQAFLLKLSNFSV